jgi:hypothetical protein
VRWHAIDASAQCRYFESTHRFPNYRPHIVSKVDYDRFTYSSKNAARQWRFSNTQDVADHRPTKVTIASVEDHWLPPYRAHVRPIRQFVSVQSFTGPFISGLVRPHLPLPSSAGLTQLQSTPSVPGDLYLPTLVLSVPHPPAPVHSCPSIPFPAHCYTAAATVFLRSVIDTAIRVRSSARMNSYSVWTVDSTHAISGGASITSNNSFEVCAIARASCATRQ